MARKLSVILHGRSGCTIRHLHLSGRHIAFAAAAGIICLAAGLYGCIDYLLLRLNQTGQEQLAAKIQAMSAQQEQVEKFAEQIDQIKERLTTLNSFEERIRTMANLAPDENEEPSSGVGGSEAGGAEPAGAAMQSFEHRMQDTRRRVAEIDDLSQKQHDAFTQLLDRLEDQKNLLARTPAIRPAEGWVTSTFAYRESPFTGLRELHKGVDIANHSGTPVVATADGEVTFAGENDSWGKVVVIDHGRGVTTRYAHLEKTLKKVGAGVKRGDVIALMGNSGRSTGPHVHYEVRVKGIPVRPDRYFLN